MTPSTTPSDDPVFRLGQLDVEEHLRDPTIKQRFVTTMFDVIAPRYDHFTRVFSFGMDRGWKRLLLQEVERAVPTDGVVTVRADWPVGRDSGPLSAVKMKIVSSARPSFPIVSSSSPT